MSEVKVAALNYYPIKSCGGIEANEVTFTELGIEHDREWMLVGKNGQFLSRRTHPGLAIVQTRIENETLFVEAPYMGRLAVPLEQDESAEVIGVDLFKKHGTGTVVGAEANDYFSVYLDKDVRLIQVKQPRQIKPECRVDGASEVTGFADGYQMSLTSTLSLEALNRVLENPVAMSRFRPNIVVEGARAYDEDYWREFQIGKLAAHVVRANAKCPIPNIDQNVGVLTKHRPVTEALRATRQGVDPVNDSTGEFFGVYLTHVYEPGLTVRVGDTVEVTARSATRNFALST